VCQLGLVGVGPRPRTVHVLNVCRAGEHAVAAPASTTVPANFGVPRAVIPLADDATHHRRATRHAEFDRDGIVQLDSGHGGCDAGKKINGHKPFIVTDTLGLLLVVVVMAASCQDRDGAKSVLLDTRLRTRARFVFADGGFAGRLLDWAQAKLCITLHIVHKPVGNAGSP
jgi:Transposase DDE domain